MRTAGLPTFKKLHRCIRTTDLQEGDILQARVLHVSHWGTSVGDLACVVVAVWCS